MSRMNPRSPLLVVIALGVLLAPSFAVAHEPPKVVVRELVRLQGFRRADGAAPAGRMTLRAQGVDHPFAATDRRVFALTVEGREPPKLADRYTLQGPRPLLARFGGAGPDQLVSILAERRPGNDELFILALDLCVAPQ